MKHVLILWLLVSLEVQAQFNPQPDAITQKFFPEATIDISTPAFQKSTGFTRYAEMMDWLQATIVGHENEVVLSFIGESQKGKKIPMLVLTSPEKKAKTRVWMQGGLHGDEPAGTETMLFLIHNLLNNKAVQPLLGELEIAIVPMANIDGYEKQSRYSANGIDLNRDQTTLKAPESVALKRAFNAFNPSVALDFHEYRPFRKDFTRLGSGGVTSLYDAMFLYSGNLNVPEDLRNLTHDRFVKNACQVLDRHELRHHDYLTPQKNGGRVEFNLGSVHSRSSATSYALANSVSTLLEIRGVGIGRTSFKRRVKTSYLIALSYLETAVKERNVLETVLANTRVQQNPVVVTSERLEQRDTLPMIDLGTKKEIRVPVLVHNALKSRPILQRERPTAYLILAQEKEAVDRLRVLGIRVDSMVADTELEVEVYQTTRKYVAGNEEEEKDEEGNDAVAEAGATQLRSIKFRRGTWIVAMNQQRAGLAAEVLEPENVNSFVLNGIIGRQPVSELAVYRYMKKEEIKR